MERVTIYQLNCHRCRAASANLAAEVLGPSKIALIQEPYYYRNKMSDFNGYATLHAGEEKQRTAIVGDKNLNLWLDGRYSDRDVTSALVQTSYQKVIYLVSLCLDINRNGGDILPKKFSDLIEYCKGANIPMLVGGDLNAHSYLWADTTNARGEALEELLIRHDLTVENIGTEPTFIARGTSTTIDVTLTRGTVPIVDWKVEDEPTFSDHRLISFGLEEVEKPTKHQLPNYQRANWDKFRALTEK